MRLATRTGASWTGFLVFQRAVSRSQRFSAIPRADSRTKPCVTPWSDPIAVQPNCSARTQLRRASPRDPGRNTQNWTRRQRFTVLICFRCFDNYVSVYLCCLCSRRNDLSREMALIAVPNRDNEKRPSPIPASTVSPRNKNFTDSEWLIFLSVVSGRWGQLTFRRRMLQKIAVREILLNGE